MTRPSPPPLPRYAPSPGARAQVGTTLRVLGYARHLSEGLYKLDGP